MSKEDICLIKGLDMNNIDAQLAIQCAPVITGIMISNLLNISRENEQELIEVLSKAGLSYYRMFKLERRITYLVFRRAELEEYISREENRDFLKEEGYTQFTLGNVLPMFQKRYYKNIKEHSEFPHEMGILLGYPIEDVKGFVENEGKNFLYSGYWKVYSDLNKKMEIFRNYDLAVRKIINLISNGGRIYEYN